MIKMGKEIEVVTGDGSNLNISPVEDHMNSLRPKKNAEKKQIIIPKSIKQKDDKEEKKEEIEKKKNTEN